MKPSPRDILSADHRRLQGLFDEITSAADAGVDSRTLGEIWNTFERGVRGHFEVEERTLFPLLLEAHPADIAALQHEHDAIRGVFDELGVAVDLHFIRARNVAELVARLQAHAAREDATIYHWADDLPDDQREALTLEDRLTETQQRR